MFTHLLLQNKVAPVLDFSVRYHDDDSICKYSQDTLSLSDSEQ